MRTRQAATDVPPRPRPAGARAPPARPPARAGPTAWVSAEFDLLESRECRVESTQCRVLDRRRDGNFRSVHPAMWSRRWRPATRTQRASRRTTTTTTTDDDDDIDTLSTCSEPSAHESDLYHQHRKIKDAGVQRPTHGRTRGSQTGEALPEGSDCRDNRGRRHRRRLGSGATRPGACCGGA